MALSPARIAPSILVLTLILFILTGSAARASQWPSWRGPSQNGVSDETGLISSWSTDGDNLIWRADFVGRSTPVVFDGRVCASGRTREGIAMQEVVACWNAENGQPRWERRFDVYNTTVPFNRVGWASVVADPETGYLYAHGVDGLLICFDRDGQTVWEWRLGEDFGRASGYGGRTHTPTLDEDRLILSVIGAHWGDHGGPPRHRYFAFDKRTGDVVWVSKPSNNNVADMNTQSTPVAAVINGQRLLIGGYADGWIYAIKARTGEKVWEFHLSKRGINTSVVVDGTTVYAAHSEENFDEGTMGRVVAIDATGSGDVTPTHEQWRLNELPVGFSSPMIYGGRLYVVDSSANLYAVDAAEGTILWQHGLGTVGKASAVWADGKIYMTEVNGNVHILQPGPTGVTALDEEHVEMPDGRYAEIYGSFAVAYERLYFTSEEGIYCLGDRRAAFRAEPGRPVELAEAAAPANATPSLIQVVPAEVVATAGDTVTFTVRAFDDRGRVLRLGEARAVWSLDGLRGRIGSDGTLTTDRAIGSHGGKVMARLGDLTATAQVRLAGPLPWSENFETGRPAHWIGGGPNVRAVDEAGEQLLRKGPSPTGLHRHAIYIGPESMSGYTIQADVMATEQGRRRPDIGLINGGYTLDLQGNHQRLEIRAWAATLRMATRVPFAWDANVWYTVKLRVDAEPDTSLIRGKVWKRDEPEPDGWTITAEDPLAIQQGSPGLLGYSPIDIFFDNVRVIENP